MTEVLFERKGHVAVFTLNRPKARNAINAALSAKMESLLDIFEQDDDLWVGILTSSTPGQAFSAGADLKEISAGRNVEGPKGGFAGLVRYPRRKPLIAAVDGPALAGGMEIVLACDLVVASSRSRFGVPEVKRSLVPAAGGVFRLPRRFPRNIALEMVLTGDPISAVRAEQLGFVNTLVHDPRQVLPAAHALAARIVANAPMAVRLGLDLVERSTLATDDENWNMAAESFRTLRQTEDYYEGPRAFVEKRAPKWTGKLRKAKL
eukprot:m.215104 g.215104  ORF g.215104 m.215104 type:complete len:263 (+) comp27585_c0_seq1:61-849(+)